MIKVIIADIVVGLVIAVGSWWLIRHVHFNKKPAPLIKPPQPEQTVQKVPELAKPQQKRRTK